MAYNYNNYFNNCGVGCGDYANHGDNGGYNNHDNNYCYNYDYAYHHDSKPHSDHSNCNGGGSNTHYDGIENHTDHYNYYCNQYSEYGYNNHSNTPTHANHFDSSPSATTMIYSIPGIDAYSTDDWVKLGDAIGDLKKLRDAVSDIPNKKLDAEGKDFSMSLSNVANADDKFTSGQTAKAGQFNETRSNIKNLWKKIWGSDGSGWPAEVKHGDKMKKDDYQKLFNKVDSLARLDQSKFYSNHYNSSKGGQNNGK